MLPYKAPASSISAVVIMDQHTVVAAVSGIITLLCFITGGYGSAGEMHHVDNPCTRAALLAEQLYHPYPHDPHRYIQCTTWGKAYVMMCPHHQTWSQHRQTCVQGPEPPQKKTNLYTRLETPRSRQPQPTPPPPRMQVPTNSKKSSGGGGGGGINWPNPCNHPSIEYVPHPTNPQQYFKCRDGSLEGHSCGHGEVWIQPSHACINIQDRIPHTESPNPCLTNSEQRFHRYPGDMHRYIECVAWYKMQVWHCGPDAVWMQSQQSCVAIAVQQQPSPRPPPVRPQTRPRPRPATTQPPPPAPTQTATDFCTHSLSFYHPYKPDPMKYIQCDEYGNMYIRSCGPKKMWSDFYKTCIGHLQHDNETHTEGGIDVNPGANANSGEDDNAGSAQTVSINLEPINYVNDFVQVTCPNGYQYNGNTGLCEYAGNEVAFDYNPYSPSCNDTFLWDTQMQMCVRAIKVDNIPPNFRPQGPQGPSMDLGSGPQVLPPGETRSPAPGPYIAPPVPTIPVPEYTGPNPCLESADQYYFQYPGDARFFLQCDEAGQVTVVACPVGTMWTDQGDGSFSCMDWLVAVPNEDSLNSDGEPGLESILGEDDLQTIAQLSLDNEEEAAFLKAINPCFEGTSDTLAYYMYPLDPHRYIQCSNGRPNLMSCAPGTMWDPNINTCGHLIKADQILESDEVSTSSGEEN